MSTYLRILAIAIVATVFSTGAWGSALANPVGTNPETPGDAHNAFAFALYGCLREQEGNLSLSPCALSSVLAVTYAGARGNTSRQMAKVLNLRSEAARSLQPLGDMLQDLRDRGKKEQYALVMANALWVSKGQEILPEFTERIKAWPQMGIRGIDFAANPDAGIKAINAWTEKQTSGQVRGMAPAGAVEPSARLVLSSAALFKGVWASPFSEDSTSQAPFQTAAGKSVTVPMMAKTGPFRYLGEQAFQILEMDYAGKDVSMVVILPKSHNGLPDLEKELTLENFNDWLSRLVEKQVSIYFPMFTLNSGLMLADALKALGMSDAFSLPPADFSGIDGKKDLAIDQVVHKAVIGVNERGSQPPAQMGEPTEEAASFPETEFAADHPFVFVIRDKQTGSILLMGRVVNPSIRQQKRQ